MAPNKLTATNTVTAALATAVGYLSGIDWQLTAIDWSVALPWLAAFATAVGLITDKAEKKHPSIKDVGVVLNEDDINNKAISRGRRLQNPGNLRGNGDQWLGMVGVDADNHIIFSEAKYGIRAMARNLRNYQRKHGIRTIDQIIHRYAPASDNNDPDSYIAFVSKKTGFPPSSVLDLEDDEIMLKLIRPMIAMELGSQPYSTELLRAAVKLA